MKMSNEAKRTLLASATDFAAAAANSSLPQVARRLEGEDSELLRLAMRNLMRETSKSGALVRDKNTGVFGVDEKAIENAAPDTDPRSIASAYLGAIEAHVKLRPVLEAEGLVTYMNRDVKRHISEGRAGQKAMLGEAAAFTVHVANAGLGPILDEKMADGSNPELSTLRSSVRDLSLWMWRTGAIVQEDNGGSFQVDESNLAIAATRPDIHRPLRSFDIASLEHYKNGNTLREVGMSDYMDTMIAQKFINPDNPWAGLIGVRDERLHAITSSALNAVDVIDKTPEEVAFVKGFDNGAHERLVGALSEAGYLVPGDNPMRTKPLREQEARGSIDQFNQIQIAAAEMVANVEPRDTATGFREAGLQSALMELKGNVAEYGRGVYDAPETALPERSNLSIQGDLLPGDAKISFEVFEAFSKLESQAQIDPSDIFSVQVPDKLVKNLENAIFVYDDNNTKAAFTAQEMVIPGIAPDTAKMMAKTVELIRDSIQFPENSVSSGEINADDDEVSDNFVVENESSSDEFEYNSDRDAESMDVIDGSKTKGFTRISMDTLDDISAKVDQIRTSGALTALASIAGIDNENRIDFMSPRRDLAGYGTLRDALSVVRPRSDSKIEKVTDAMSIQAWNNLNPQTKANLPAVRFLRNTPAFPDMPASFGANPEKKIRKYLYGRIFSQDEEVAKKVRNSLRMAQHSIVIAPTQKEAESFKKVSDAFITAEQTAMKEVTERKNAKAFKHEAVFNTKAVSAIVDAVEKVSGSFSPKEQNVSIYAFPPKGGIDGNGKIGSSQSNWGAIAMVHDDGPMITTRTHDVPNPMKEKDREAFDRKAFTPKAQLLGQISIADIQEAVRAGREQVVVVFSETTPVKSMPRSLPEETNDKQKEKTGTRGKKRYEPVSLS